MWSTRLIEASLVSSLRDACGDVPIFMGFSQPTHSLEPPYGRRLPLPRLLIRVAEVSPGFRTLVQNQKAEYGMTKHLLLQSGISLTDAINCHAIPGASSLSYLYKALPDRRGRWRCRKNCSVMALGNRFSSVSRNSSRDLAVARRGSNVKTRVLPTSRLTSKPESSSLRTWR